MTDDGPWFVDSNVLLYVLDGRSPEKRRRAGEWMDALWQCGSGRTSWQVLNEYYHNAIRKIGAHPREARPMVHQLARWDPVGFGLGVIEQAWYWSDRASLSYWDALILAAAEQSGSRYLLSEDFQDGRVFDSVRVVNPFRADPASCILSS